MNKTFAIACILPIIALSGCGEKTEKTVSLPEKFTVCAEITEQDFSATAEMKRLETGWEITMTAPETLEGMQIMLTDADCTIDYRELSYTAANDDMPANSPLRLTALSLDKCVHSKTSGTINGAEYEFTFSGDKPERLTIGSEIEVTFSDYKA